MEDVILRGGCRLELTLTDVTSGAARQTSSSTRCYVPAAGCFAALHRRQRSVSFPAAVPPFVVLHSTWSMMIAPQSPPCAPVIQVQPGVLRISLGCCCLLSLRGLRERCFRAMRYTNRHFTYLLTYLLAGRPLSAVYAGSILLMPKR